jgi:hypothetical protein
VSKLGKKLIRGMRQFIADVKAGKPVKQRTVRRMKVKGKTVYVHDSFTAPIGPPNGGAP